MNFNVNSLVAAKANARPSGEQRPMLTLVGTVNRFSLNTAAIELMRLEPKDYVTILINPDAQHINERFIITKGFGSNKVLLAPGNGNEDSGSLNFSWADIYSRIMQGTVDAIGLAPEVMAKNGFYNRRNTKGGAVAYSAVHKVHMYLKSIGSFQLEGMTEEQELFVLEGRETSEYTQKTITRERKPKADKDKSPIDFSDEGMATAEVEVEETAELDLGVEEDGDFEDTL